MDDLYIRTEDIKPSDIKGLFVSTEKEREIIDKIKAQSPTLIVGSRGVGKSFLLRVAEKELNDSFSTEKILPIYVTFSSALLLETNDRKKFQHWMLARICHSTIRTLRKFGFSSGSKAVLSHPQLAEVDYSSIVESFEATWKTQSEDIPVGNLPTVDDFKEYVEDICETLEIERFCILFDEAAHVFYPEQQRQFFTLFRDLRSPYISCNATVYPGLTSYGDTFQPAHDAILLPLSRDVRDEDYVKTMRDIVEKQAALKSDTALLDRIENNAENFLALAYSASGNPRLLVKSLLLAPKLNSRETSQAIKNYYRTDIWSEFSNLSEVHVAYKPFFDWGRKFIEDVVLKKLLQINDEKIKNEEDGTTFYFWIHRDAPETVKFSLRLLSYTGIILEHTTGYRGTRAEIGTRYAVNVGCYLALDANPASSARPFIKSVSVNKMPEFGANHPEFQEVLNYGDLIGPPDAKYILKRKLQQPIDVLDIPSWIVGRLKSIGILYIEDALNATEEKIQEAYYIGEVRSRMTKNAAMNSVLEYLSG